ncbi:MULTISPECIES: DUF3726 domain-containing protein [unclassified Ruegeria]|uniref:DUF3726 domain-containing protein n=1 Tax=unclassified Ruegeria TaxID=2625375 RepID=UPI001ADAB0DD|nr:MULTISPECIES: DUF3726 domain-containing protein [unclassified Ruegeria]MBO9410903.1 DUF3726 domain-containing protein [Ruegeria sp. R8_1]MBO9415104.1 DUF3726 domain-containing protein [Ruegeria sp. R8_2]
MNLSLNEVEATAKRAMRGVGHSWGHAEEAAKATRWLCAQGMDGIGTLAKLAKLQSAQPNLPAADCPIAAGAQLSDQAAELRKEDITLQDIVFPVLLLPFAANVARFLDTPVSVTMDKAQFVTDGFALTTAFSPPEQASQITIKRGGIMIQTHPQCTRATPDPADWSELNRLAHFTYAPATEDSRLRGAGAGLSDND